MNAKVLSLAIFLICSVFVYTDYSVNGYEEYLTEMENSKQSSDEAISVSPSITASALPKEAPALKETITPQENANMAQNDQLLVQIFSKNNLKINIIKTSEADTFFSLVSASAIPFIEKGIIYSLIHENVPFRIHELKIQPTKAVFTYQVIQDTFLMLKKPTYAVNITNKYGDASFYLNDKTKNDAAFLVILFKKIDYIYLFEYPKNVHSAIETLINTMP